MSWKGCGYISKSKEGNSVTIMIDLKGTVGKKYFVAPLQDTLDALTGRRNFAKISRKKGER